MDIPPNRFADAVQRVRNEYLEMPGLQLTREQAARLWQFDRDLCDAVLSTLVDAKFLVRIRDVAFARGAGRA
jgi:hypothetical protein